MKTSTPKESPEEKKENTVYIEVKITLHRREASGEDQRDCQPKEK